MKKKPLYLFVCVENARRSQMAQGFFNKLTNGAIGDSAGTRPAKIIDLTAIKAMKEKNIDISKQTTKKLTGKLASKTNKIITMGCIDNCPYISKDKIIKWNIPDPKGKDVLFYAEIRDLIEQNIMKLLKEENLI